MSMEWEMSAEVTACSSSEDCIIDLFNIIDDIDTALDAYSEDVAGLKRYLTEAVKRRFRHAVPEGKWNGDLVWHVR